MKKMEIVSMSVQSILPNATLLIARILFSGIYILAAFEKIINYQSTIDYMTHSGIPYANIVIIPTIFLELGGALMVLFGLFTRIGALFLFVFTLIVSFAIHHFWNYSVDEKMIQMINFEKNMSMLGGAIYIFIFGAGIYSFDELRRKYSPVKDPE